MSLPVPAKAGPFGRLARFLLVGMGNTLLSLSIIAALLASGTGPFTANAAGFACGFAMSFVLNRRFTFGMRGRARLFEVLPFAACMAAAYIVNLAVLGLAGHSGVFGPLASQIVAMGSYTLTFYLLTSTLVYPNAR